MVRHDLRVSDAFWMSSPGKRKPHTGAKNGSSAILFIAAGISASV